MAFYGPLPFESVTVSSAAVGITTRPGGSGMKASAALIEVESNPIRYRVDGTNPTSSVGILIQAGGVIELHDWGEVKNFKAIRQGGSDATLRVQPYIGG